MGQGLGFGGLSGRWLVCVGGCGNGDEIGLRLVKKIYTQQEKDGQRKADVCISLD
jgi:hypothetical protein